MLNDESLCKANRICYQIAFQVGCDFQAAATTSLSRQFSSTFAIATCSSAELREGGSLMRLGILLLRNSIEAEPSDLPPHRSIDKSSRARCGKLAPWRLSH